jgi:hypothetical protein
MIRRNFSTCGKAPFLLDKKFEDEMKALVLIDTLLFSLLFLCAKMHMFLILTNVSQFCWFITISGRCMIRGEEGWGMITIATTLIIIFIVIILIGTLMVAGKSDPGYGKKAKNTTVTISAIYLLVTVLAVAGIAVYVYFI